MSDATTTAVGMPVTIRILGNDHRYETDVPPGPMIEHIIGSLNEEFNLSLDPELHTLKREDDPNVLSGDEPVFDQIQKGDVLWVTKAQEVAA